MAMITIESSQLIMNYVVFVLLGFGILYFMLKSLVPAWLSVRFSGGSKILVHVANPLMDYYKPGKIDAGFLYYKARRRSDNPDPNRMLWVGDIREFSYRALGVNVIDVDDIKNCVWSRTGVSTSSDKGVSSNYEAVSTNNAEAYDEAQYTALHKPSTKKALFDEYTWQLIVLGVAVLVVVGLVLVYRQIGTVDGHVKLVYDMVTTTNTMLNVTGV